VWKQLDALHRRIASVALSAAARHGFALGGGNALIAHGVINRLTEDVDLVTNRERGVRAAAGPVEAALRREGFTAQRDTRLAGLFPDWEDGMTEWTITAPSGRRTDLQMACFDRSREPVFMEGIGPVLHLEDVAGNKVWALADRVKVRDYVDTAALLARWTPAELIGFARRVEPDLPDRYLADAARRLDQMPDEAFMSSGLTRQDVATLRKRFAAWPRDARAVSRGKGDSAARQEREEPSHTRGQSRDLRVGSEDARPRAERGQGQAAQRPGRRRPAGRERIRDDEPELDR